MIRRPFDWVDTYPGSIGSREHLVYVHLDAEGYALYIGHTTDLELRNDQHKTAEWWPKVVEIRAIGPWTREIALGIERGLIAQFQPPHNNQYTVKWEQWNVNRRKVKNDGVVANIEDPS